MLSTRTYTNSFNLQNSPKRQIVVLPRFYGELK